MLLLDWRDDTRLPRDGYFERRGQDVSGIIIHNTGGLESIEADNDYHRRLNWGDGARAPHIAYHFWIPRDWSRFLDDRAADWPDKAPQAVVVWCNHLWERTWHARLANDSCIGIACQVNGETHGLNDYQRDGVRWLIDVFLPSQGVIIPRSNIWGHGETPAIHGGGPSWDNLTVCPGRYVLPWVRALRE